MKAYIVNGQDLKALENRVNERLKHISRSALVSSHIVHEPAKDDSHIESWSVMLMVDEMPDEKEVEFH